jgi:hypothetical protein
VGGAPPLRWAPPPRGRRRVTGSRRDGPADVEGKAERLRERLPGAMARLISAGADDATVNGTLERLTTELEALDARAGTIRRLRSDSEAAGAQLDGLGALAATAADRLASLDLRDRAEVLELLDVRVEVLDASRTPPLQVRGVVRSVDSAGQGPRS